MTTLKILAGITLAVAAAIYPLPFVLACTLVLIAIPITLVVKG